MEGVDKWPWISMWTKSKHLVEQFLRLLKGSHLCLAYKQTSQGVKVQVKCDIGNFFIYLNKIIMWRMVKSIVPHITRIDKNRTIMKNKVINEGIVFRVGGSKDV